MDGDLEGQDGGDEGDATPSGLTRIVVRGIGVAGLGFVITQMLNLAAYIILARLATPADFGEFAAGAILVNIAILLVGLESGILTAIVQRRDRLEEASSTAVLATLASGIGFSLLALALSPLIGAYFHSSEIGRVAAASSGLLFLRTITVVPLALLQRRFSYIRRVIVEPIGVVIFAITAIIATSNGMGVWGLVLGTYAQFGADVLLSGGLLRWRPQMRLASMEMWRELVGYARHVFAATAIYRVGQQVPMLLLGRFSGAGPLGQFRYAERIASFPFSVLLSAASYVLFPAFARIAEDGDRLRLRAAFLRAFRGIALFGMPAGFLTLALSKPTAILVFGDVWTDAGEAGMALFAVPAVGTLAALATNLLFADDRPERVVRIHAFEVVLGTIAMAVLLGPLDLVGVCIGVSIGAIAGALYGLREVGSVLVIPPHVFAREVAGPLIAAAISGACILALEFGLVDAASRSTGVGLLALAGEAILGAVIYLSALHLIAPRYTRELGQTVRAGRGRAPDPRLAGAVAESEASEREIGP
jgi:O-antigen/teichoic acid export membrane protein